MNSQNNSFNKGTPSLCRNNSYTLPNNSLIIHPGTGIFIMPNNKQGDPDFSSATSNANSLIVPLAAPAGKYRPIGDEAVAATNANNALQQVTNDVNSSFIAPISNASLVAPVVQINSEPSAKEDVGTGADEEMILNRGFNIDKKTNTVSKVIIGPGGSSFTMHAPMPQLVPSASAVVLPSSTLTSGVTVTNSSAESRNFLDPSFLASLGINQDNVQQLRGSFAFNQNNGSFVIPGSQIPNNSLAMAFNSHQSFSAPPRVTNERSAKAELFIFRKLLGCLGGNDEEKKLIDEVKANIGAKPHIIPPVSGEPIYQSFGVKPSEEFEVGEHERPKVTLSSFSDCFRLFFGTNVTLFPFLTLKLGIGGIIIFSAFVGYYMIELMLSLHHAKHNLIVIENRRQVLEYQKTISMQAQQTSLIVEQASAYRDENSNSLRTSESFSGSSNQSNSTFDTSSNGAFGPKRRLSLVVSLPNSDSSKGESENTCNEATSMKTVTFEQPSTVPLDDESINAYFYSISSYVLLVGALWSPDHPFSYFVKTSVFLAQFFSCCSYSMLVCQNIITLFNLPFMPTLLVSCTVLGGLTLLTTPFFRSAIAIVNNLCLVFATIILIILAAMHEPSDDNRVYFPEDAKSFAINFPTVCFFLSGTLLTIDMETFLSFRIFSFLPINSIYVPILKAEAVAEGESSPASSRLSNNRNEKDDEEEMKNSDEKIGLFQEIKKRLFNLNLISKYYAFMISISMFATLVILLVFGIFFYLRYLSDTNSVIANSLQDGPPKLIVLALLTLGTLACAALTVSPIADFIDFKAKTLCVCSQKSIFVWSKKTLGRVFLFIPVFAILVLVPFFDLVASLAGSVAGSLTIFIIPPIFEIRSEMLRVREHERLQVVIASGDVSAAPPILPTYYLISKALERMTWKRKIVFFSGIVIGIFVFIAGTFFALLTAVTRGR